MMDLHLSIYRATFVAFSVAFLISCGGSGSAPVSQSSSTLPATIQETETDQYGFTATAVWTRTGTSMTYSGKANNGAIETLTVSSWKTGSNGVVILRSDNSGSSEGLTAKYVGALTTTGKSVAGNVEWKSPGFDTLGTWSASW